VLVIDDAGPTTSARALAARFGVRYEPHARPLGLNVARNTGVERSAGELVVFVDDDIRASGGWLQALLDAAREHPEVDVFTGPIHARLEGRELRTCGREAPPITSLELGAQDTDARYAWGANMAIRRSALERVGPFDVSLEHGGDEQEWQDRMRKSCAGGACAEEARVLYVARAGVDHRRAGADASLGSLARGAHARGRAARQFDARRGQAPSLARELRTLAGCAGHVIRRRCPAGLTMVAHSAGRLREGARERLRRQEGDQIPGAAIPAGAAPHVQAHGRGAGGDERVQEEPLDFLSGASGTVGGFDAVRRGARDELVDAWELASGRRLALKLAARREPPGDGCSCSACSGTSASPWRRLRVRSCWAPVTTSSSTSARLAAKASSRTSTVCSPPIHRQSRLAAGGRRRCRVAAWLPRPLPVPVRAVQPAARPARASPELARSMAADATPPAQRRARDQLRRDRACECVRERNVRDATAVSRAAHGLGPGCTLGGYRARTRMRCGVVDAVAIRHRAAPAADAYSRADAIAEARAFLAERPYVSAGEAQRTLTTHRRW